MNTSVVVCILLIFAICLLSGLPVVMAMAAGALVPLFMGMPGATTFPALVRSIFGSAENTTLIAIPLFILAGNVMSEGKLRKSCTTYLPILWGTRPVVSPVPLY